MYPIRQKELECLSKEISTIQQQLLTFPPGRLQCKHNGKYIKWFKTEDGKREWWHVQIGDKYEPVPTRQELYQGNLEYGDEMTMLLQLRSRIIGELANQDFSNMLNESMRETYVAALLHSV